MNPEEATFSICPYCGSWNEVKELDKIAGVILCFHCDVGFNFNPDIEDT
jgi:hypothetical protein